MVVVVRSHNSSNTSDNIQLPPDCQQHLEKVCFIFRVRSSRWHQKSLYLQNIPPTTLNLSKIREQLLIGCHIGTVPRCHQCNRITTRNLSALCGSARQLAHPGEIGHGSLCIPHPTCVISISFPLTITQQPWPEFGERSTFFFSTEF